MIKIRYEIKKIISLQEFNPHNAHKNGKYHTTDNI